MQIEQRIKKELEENPALEEGSEEDEDDRSMRRPKKNSLRKTTRTRRNSHLMIILKMTRSPSTGFRQTITARRMKRGTKFRFQSALHSRNILNRSSASGILMKSKKSWANIFWEILMKTDISDGNLQT